MILKEFSPDLSALTAQHMSNLAKLMFHFDFENSRVRIHVSLVWSAGLRQLKQKKMTWLSTERQKCPAVDPFLGHTAILVGPKPPRPWISHNHQSHR